MSLKQRINRVKFGLTAFAKDVEQSPKSVHVSLSYPNTKYNIGN